MFADRTSSANKYSLKTLKGSMSCNSNKHQKHMFGKYLCRIQNQGGCYVTWMMFLQLHINTLNCWNPAQVDSITNIDMLWCSSCLMMLTCPLYLHRRHTSRPSATPDTELPPLVADIAPVPQFALESRAWKTQLESCCLMWLIQKHSESFRW